MADILLLEADQDLRERVLAALKAQNHDVSAVEDSAAARKTTRSKVPSLVIVGQSADPEGGNFLDMLAKDRRLSRVPVMLLVDPDHMELALNIYECDVYAILKKPIDLGQLLLQTETILRQTTRQKQSRRRERHELRSRITRLEREVRATTEDLTDAAQNFTTMLATPPKPQGIRIDIQFAPSGGFIGGDFYDFVWLDERRLCVVLGDVTGHGIQAAVIQSMARKVISIGMRIKNGDLREGLRFANDELADDIPQGKFVAALVGVLDVVTGNWQHARCGVPHPVLVRANGKREDILTAGVALGLRRSSNWADAIQVHKTNIEPDGRIVLFTDGIIECTQDDGEEFDYKGVHAVLDRAKPGDNVPEMIHRSAHAAHRAEDDVLIISITRAAPELTEPSGSPEFDSLDDDSDLWDRR